GLNVAVDIAAGAAQNFLIGLTPTAPFAPTNVAFAFSCSNVGSAASISGVNTLLASGSTTPVADVVALAASSDSGILDMLGNNGAAAFAVATVNVGAAATITASADTGGVSLPLSLAL